MFNLGFEGLVRFGYRDMMEGKCLSEGMYIFRILFENNWGFLFVIKEFVKVGWGGCGWSGGLELSYEWFLGFMCNGRWVLFWVMIWIELCFEKNNFRYYIR